jgi:CheY-like chemotaxis protein
MRSKLDDMISAFKIVLIDDNDDGRSMLRCLCELQGHEVYEAADGIAGVACAVETQPDIAFVDIGLPGIDGYEVARRVRARSGQLPYLVALSGYGSSEHRALAFAAGFDEHIAKPMQMVQFAAVIAHARESRDHRS